MDAKIVVWRPQGKVVVGPNYEDSNSFICHLQASAN